MTNIELIEQLNQKNLHYDNCVIHIDDITATHQTNDVITISAIGTIVRQRNYHYDTYGDDWEEYYVPCEIFLIAVVCDNTICDVEVEECIIYE